MCLSKFLSIGMYNHTPLGELCLSAGWCHAGGAVCLSELICRTQLPTAAGREESRDWDEAFGKWAVKPKTSKKISRPFDLI